MLSPAPRLSRRPQPPTANISAAHSKRLDISLTMAGACMRCWRLLRGGAFAAIGQRGADTGPRQHQARQGSRRMTPPSPKSPETQTPVLSLQCFHYKHSHPYTSSQIRVHERTVRATKLISSACACDAMHAACVDGSAGRAYTRRHARRHRHTERFMRTSTAPAQQGLRRAAWSIKGSKVAGGIMLHQR